VRMGGKEGELVGEEVAGRNYYAEVG